MKTLIIAISSLISTFAFAFAADKSDYTCKATVVEYSVQDGNKKVLSLNTKELQAEAADGRSLSVDLGHFIFVVKQPSSRNASPIKLTIYDTQYSELALVSDVLAAKPTIENEVSVVADVDQGLTRTSLVCAIR